MMVGVRGGCVCVVGACAWWVRDVGVCVRDGRENAANVEVSSNNSS